MKKLVCVIGQGYVGLPLALAIAESDYSVIGIDSDIRKISKLNSGFSGIADVSDESLKKCIDTKKYIAASDFSLVSEACIIIICVPTPITKENLPDLSYLESATASISKYMSPGALVIIESTVEPGTTREFVLPLIKKESKLNYNQFYLAFSPERIDPSNKNWNVKNTPKLVSGLTEESCKIASEFYSKFITDVIRCDSLEVAETAKLLENSFRFINISFINEFAIFCKQMKIDINSVINAANTKPYGFMPFYPSIGVGGHCIPIDPLYLANKAREIGAPTRFIDLADRINHEIPFYFVARAEEAIGELVGKKILVIGVSYKPNVSDTRETPVAALVSGLKEKGAQVLWHDDLVKEWNGEKSVTLSSNFDLAIIASPHDYLDLTKLGNVPILNTRGSIE